MIRAHQGKASETAIRSRIEDFRDGAVPKQLDPRLVDGITGFRIDDRSFVAVVDLPLTGTLLYDSGLLNVDRGRRIRYVKQRPFCAEHFAQFRIHAAEKMKFSIKAELEKTSRYGFRFPV